MKLKRYSQFSEGLALHDKDIPTVQRTRELSNDEFVDILQKNCRNFSFDNDMLWRAKSKKFDLELFEPAYRNATPLAFPNFFNKIENDPDFPVIRKKSLIGGTNRTLVHKLVNGGGDDSDMYLVIPFDNSPIVFCPIFDLWAMDDNRKKSTEIVDKNPVSKDNFIMRNYEKGFKVPTVELQKLPKADNGLISDNGVEFFTSSPCLMVNYDKVKWLRDLLLIINM